MISVPSDIFSQLGIIIVITAITALILRLCKQPTILAYVLVGIILGPTLHLITNISIIESMSVIGVAFLLFLVGLEMDLKSLRDVAIVSTFGAAIQIALLFVTGFFIALLLGFLSIEAAYIGLLLCFSSTMVVLKILSDRRELNTLHGRIITGILLTEDIVAIFALTIFSSINDFSLNLFFIAITKFIGLFAAAYVASKFIFPKLFTVAAKNQELLSITSLATCFLFAISFQYLGFSLAVGAFIGGLTIGTLQYKHEIIGKIKSLKDFFSLLFFVSLGMGISIAVLKKWWLAVTILIAIVLFIKPIIIMTVCSLFRYTKKPSFLTANGLAQVGEFGLILASQGLLLGHINQDLFSIIIFVTLTTIVLTSYSIPNALNIYNFLKKPLKIFDRLSTKTSEFQSHIKEPTIVLCGHNRIGYSILRDMHDIKKDLLVIDYNPEIINMVANQGYHCIYGEATDEEVIEHMNLPKLKIFISTIPETKDNISLIQKIRAVNKKTHILVTAQTIEESLKLYEHGADYVILPHFLGGEHVSSMITNLRKDKLNLKKERLDHLKHLNERKRIGHKHPI